MKRLLIVISLLTVLAIACASSANSAEMPLVIHTPANAVSTPEASPMPRKTTTPLLTVGCWNIREGDGTSFPVARVSCDELLTVLAVANNGFVEVEGGYICNQAFGYNEECR